MPLGEALCLSSRCAVASLNVVSLRTGTSKVELHQDSECERIVAIQTAYWRH